MPARVCESGNVTPPSPVHHDFSVVFFVTLLYLFLGPTEKKARNPWNVGVVLHHGPSIILSQKLPRTLLLLVVVSLSFVNGPYIFPLSVELPRLSPAQPTAVSTPPAALVASLVRLDESRLDE